MLRFAGCTNMFMPIRFPGGRRLPIILAKTSILQRRHCMLAIFTIHVLLLFWLFWHSALVLAAEGSIQEKLEARPLQFGIMPSQSPVTLMHSYAPVKSYLEHTLKREIIISTAPSFPEFIQRTGTNEYDFVLTSPHFAKFAENQHGWVRVARAKGTQRGVFLVEKTSPYQKITDLDGKVIAIRDNLALVTLLGEQALLENGLLRGRPNISFINSPSYTSAALSVVRGTANAALISEMAFKKLPSMDKHNLRVLAYTKTAPNLMIMGNPQLDKNDLAHLRNALLHFNDDQNNSALFFHNTGFKGFNIITEQDMRFAAFFVTILQQRIAQGSS